MRTCSNAARRAAAWLAIWLCAGAAQAAALGSAAFELKAAAVPAACQFHFPDGNGWDYGEIPAGRLSASAYTALNGGDKRLRLSCDAPTRVALQFSDARGGKAGADDQFGLGGGLRQSLGYHQLDLLPSALAARDGEAAHARAYYGVSADGRAWQPLPGGGMVRHGAYYTVVDGSGQPLTFTRWQAGFRSSVMLAPGLQARDRVEFDGLVAITLHYI
ncbi:DUF1120 domain-containing protein [Chromobacterium amazonense]|uniref:DUF1120 domain-containing protein n=1 Tax=Chromobacterium amazonense TaxID=1382803 RepID=A0ABU8UY57_9NEIS|nr:DUF1120 domain-containing protein [Chromobacterium amazonense]MDQ4540973.1 DUF1120 domain-containing protein [Chromobacterium amazonense]